jgi:GPI mannosyltransferase 2
LVDTCRTADPPFKAYIVAGVIVSNVSHYLSVFVLRELLTIVLQSRQQRRIALVAAILHVFTPASLFYSAPYAEAMFCCLNLMGMVLYAKSHAAAKAGSSTFREDGYKLSSGIIFAYATLLRSNGLLNGLIYLYDIARYLPLLMAGQLNGRDVRRILVICMAGISVALGFFGPQYLAYTEFCGDGRNPPRPWCEKRVPSIYSWVQSHYW